MITVVIRLSEILEVIEVQEGDCQNYGPFLGPYYNTGPNTGPNLGDPKRDHNFDNPPRVKHSICPDLGTPTLKPVRSVSPVSILLHFRRWNVWMTPAKVGVRDDLGFRV